MCVKPTGLPVGCKRFFKVLYKSIGYKRKILIIEPAGLVLWSRQIEQTIDTIKIL